MNDSSSGKSRGTGAALVEPLESRKLLSAVTWSPAPAAAAVRATPAKHVRAAAPLNKHGHHVHHISHHHHHHHTTTTPPPPAPTPTPTPPPPPPVMSVAANVDATRASGNDMEAQIAINPTNPNNLVVVSQNDVNNGNAITISRSFDGGRSWSNLSWGPQDGYGNTQRPDARVAFDAFGNCYVAYLVAVSKTQIDVIVLQSSDGGASFGTQTIAVGSSKIDPDDPSIATGPAADGSGDQAVWVSVTDDKNHRILVTGARSSGLGDLSGWSGARVAGTGGGSYSNVAVGPSGELAVAWQSGEFGQGPNSVMFNADPTGTGSGFTGQQAVATTNVGGFDYIPAQPDRSIDAEVKVAFDRSGGNYNGRLYLAYVDEIGDESNNTDIELAYSEDLGDSWSSPTRVNDDKTANSQFLPALAVDPTTGIVGLSWMDARNSPGNNTAQLFATVSLDHGRTFQKNVQVSAGTSNQANGDPSANDLDFGDKSGLAFYAGRLVPAWADNSGAVAGNPDGANSDLDVLTDVITINA